MSILQCRWNFQYAHKISALMHFTDNRAISRRFKTQATSHKISREEKDHTKKLQTLYHSSEKSNNLIQRRENTLSQEKNLSNQKNLQKKTLWLKLWLLISYLPHSELLGITTRSRSTETEGINNAKAPRPTLPWSKEKQLHTSDMDTTSDVE